MKFGPPKDFSHKMHLQKWGVWDLCIPSRSDGLCNIWLEKFRLLSISRWEESRRPIPRINFTYVINTISRKGLKDKRNILPRGTKLLSDPFLRRHKLGGMRGYVVLVTRSLHGQEVSILRLRSSRCGADILMATWGMNVGVIEGMALRYCLPNLEAAHRNLKKGYRVFEWNRD